ncbi:hypothetical protein P3G55_20760 [Leptospira sp. 96542]|nr:hypothetical protein [Leptospira sp. 96542]
MDEQPAKTGEEAPKPAATPSDSVANNQIWAEVAIPLGKAIIEAVERFNRNNGYVTGWLLALIIVTMGGLAGMALWFDHVDTAEKTIIALISFLGGAAMFSGPPKK